MKLLLINPNLTQAVTDRVLQAAQAAAQPGTELRAVTGTFGPQVIGSRAENALAAHGVLELVAQHAPGCDAVVLAVSLDTALWACRELLDIPVVGMTEAGLLTAAMLAPRFGLLTYGQRLVDAGAEAVLLAGAAMAAMAPALQPALPVPLIDGVSCAVGMAETLAHQRWMKPRRGSVSATGGREVHGVSAELQALMGRG